MLLDARWALSPSPGVMSTSRLPPISLCLGSLEKNASFITVRGQILLWTGATSFSCVTQGINWKKKRMILRGGLFVCYLFNVLPELLFLIRSHFAIFFWSFVFFMLFTTTSFSGSFPPWLISHLLVGNPVRRGAEQGSEQL